MKSARTASLHIMTELTGEGTLELDRSALDVFGSPVAEITMPMTEWDREAHRELVKLAPEIGDAMGATRMSELAPRRDNLAAGQE